MDPFITTQNAVDIVLTSEHNKNKIAACLFDDQNYIVGTNYRPEIFQSSFSPDIRIGNSSQFIHAEVGCLYRAPFATDNASLCVTDPFCPNCAKAIAESGVRHVYIDHKGLDKDFAIRRGDDFKSLSLLIMEHAGIHVSIVYRKEKRIEELLVPQIPTRIAPTGIEFFDCDESFSLTDIIKSFRTRQPHSAWACAKTIEANGKVSGLLVFEGLPPGITPHDYVSKKDEDAKYSMTIDPVNRLLCYLKRKNLGLLNNEIGSNLVPSSRAFVNMTGFGIKSIIVGEKTGSSDNMTAMKTIKENGVISVEIA